MNAVAQISSRLPMPTGLSEYDSRKWRVLCETTFPSARTAEAIVMAIDYCQARGLDIFKKPVHIVPMWNSSLGREVETVWPGINEVQITASRTREWAGMDAPSWGPNVTRLFKGRKKGKNGWENVEVTVTFPEWCSVTVYRLVGNQRYAFTEPIYWLEAYSHVGGGELPTDMWLKRPHGQMHKVAKAASLRAAFPEEGEYTAEEMAGKEIDEEAPPTEVASPTAPPPETAWLDEIANAKTLDELGQVSQAIHKANLAADVLAKLRPAFIRRKVDLAPTIDPITSDIEEPQASPPAGDEPEVASDYSDAVNVAEQAPEGQDGIMERDGTAAELYPAPAATDATAVARKRGWDAFKAGASRKAIPGPYRGTPNQLEWQDGYDDAKAKAEGDQQ